MLEAVLSCRGVNDQKHLVGSARDFAACDAAHFLQFRHQIVFGVEAARRIHDHRVVVALFR